MTKSALPLFPEYEVEAKKGDNMKTICSSLGVDFNTPAWPDAFGKKYTNI